MFITMIGTGPTVYTNSTYACHVWIMRCIDSDYISAMCVLYISFQS